MYLNAKNTFKIKLEPRYFWTGGNTFIPSTLLMDRVMLSALPEV